MADLTWEVDNVPVWIENAQRQGYSDFARFLLSADHKQNTSDILARIWIYSKLCESFSVKEQNPELDPVISHIFINPRDYKLEQQVLIILAFKDNETKMEWMLKYG